jgi:hypothetical protein
MRFFHSFGIDDMELVAKKLRKCFWLFFCPWTSDVAIRDTLLCD